MKMTKLIREGVHHFGNGLRAIRLFFLRMSGVKIGQNTMISLGAKIDVRRGDVTIGHDCHITYGCVVLSHDGAARQIDPSDTGDGFVNIGNNVFLGVNTVVLRNVSIGDNAVVGAGSVVTRDIPPNAIACGNPAIVVRTLG